MWSKNKKLTLLLILSGVLVALIVGSLFVFGFLIPYTQARNTMDPNGTLTFLAQDDGTLRVEWEAGQNAQSYTVQVSQTDGELLHSCTVTECFAVLPELPTDRELVVRVTSGHDYGRNTRKGKDALEMTLTLGPPQIWNLAWQPNVELGTVDIGFDMPEGDLCRVYMSTGDGEPVLVEELREGELQLKLGEGEKYAVPAHGQPLHFTFQLERGGKNVTYLGNTAEGFTLTREHMLDKELNVEYVDNGENSYTLTWNETKGAQYEVLLSTNGGESWETLAVIPCDQERTYTTDHLDAYTDYTLWVVAVGGQTMPDSEFAAISEPMNLHTGAKLMYSTIWPLMDLRVFSDAEGTQEVGKVTAGSAWCALGKEGKYLKIRYNGGDGYIHSDYCMINLPEYVGDLCRYDITNSYSAIYLVHEYEIKKISGTVITGYEDVKIGDGEYLVPLLFPTAQKLIKAGEAAKEQGYTLKIYDSFRPQDATGAVYQRTASILDNPVPSYTYSGKSVRDLGLLDWDPYEEEEEENEDKVATDPAPADPTDPPAGETKPSTEGSGMATSPTEGSASLAFLAKALKATEPAEDSIVLTSGKGKPKTLTYEILMTNNGEYSLSKFLAPGLSRHNFGVAMDLTLVDSDGRELTMQTSMHDLSWYSAFKRNNANANTLYKIMSGAGLTCISSEWWHYQDNEIYAKHSYQPLKTGVSWECWVADREGWRYRLNDGSFYTNCTQVIDGQSYTFDESGYITYG